MSQKDRAGNNTRVNALTSGEGMRAFLLRGFVNTALFRRVSVLIHKRVELNILRASGVAILYKMVWLNMYIKHPATTPHQDNGL